MRGRPDLRIDGRTEVPADRWTDVQTDGRTRVTTDRWTDVQTDGRVDRQLVSDWKKKKKGNDLNSGDGFPVFPTSIAFDCESRVA